MTARDRRLCGSVNATTSVAPSSSKANDGAAGRSRWRSRGPTAPTAGGRGWTTWRAEDAFSQRFVAEAPDLDIQGVGGGRRNPIPLREVLVHRIEEYARHNGHADLIRQRIDGRVGQ
jgi:hypothetical protein